MTRFSKRLRVSCWSRHGGVRDRTFAKRLRCKFKVEWKLVECEQFEVIPRLGSERSLPEFGHSGLAAAEWADFELPLFDLLC
jgi:hypothetical protein